jgi:hypothetical protein
MRVRFHADYETADRIVAGLTVRQLIVLAITAVTAWSLFLSISHATSMLVAGILCAPVGVAGAVLIANAPDGTPMDRYLLLLIRHVLSPRGLVAAPAGLPKLARKLMGRVGAVDIPVREVSAAGFIDVGRWGTSAVMRASAINLRLRSEGERQVITDCFGRLGNSLNAPVQILVSARGIDAGAIVSRVEEAAPFLPHRSLSTSALDYCRYFRSLIADENVLRHEVYVCLREPKKGSAATAALERRAESMSTFLREAGIKAERLEADPCELAISAAIDPIPAPVAKVGTV